VPARARESDPNPSLSHAFRVRITVTVTVTGQITVLDEILQSATIFTESTVIVTARAGSQISPCQSGPGGGRRLRPPGLGPGPGAARRPSPPVMVVPARVPTQTDAGTGAPAGRRYHNE
jgi:hypothetical protein